MNRCFICKRPHSNNEKLFTHIRSHMITRNYQRAEDTCVRIFDNVKNFKRHRRRVYPDTNVNSTSQTSSQDADNSIFEFIDTMYDDEDSSDVSESEFDMSD